MKFPAAFLALTLLVSVGHADPTAQDVENAKASIKKCYAEKIAIAKEESKAGPLNKMTFDNLTEGCALEIVKGMNTGITYQDSIGLLSSSLIENK